MTGKPLMPLALAPTGTTVRVVSVEGGQGVRKRLADLGLTVSECLFVIQSDERAPVLLGIKDSRLAIGRGLAFKILVETSSPAIE